MTALALDLLGLFLSPTTRNPRGIDRVELAYARHFLSSWPDECWATLPTPWGVRCFDRARALRFLGAVDELWRETIDRDNDQVYDEAKSEILGRQTGRQTFRPRGLSVRSIIARYFQTIAKTGFSFGRSAKRALPRGAIYLNVGQLQIFRPCFWWLKRRRDVLPVFMIHDVTPIEHPAHHAPLLVRMHHRIMKNSAEFGRAFIFPSEAAARSVIDELAKHKSANFASHVELLSVPDEFLRPMKPDPDLSAANYFIMCGALDPHKNHSFVLDVWRVLIRRASDRVPKLVIVGSPNPASGPVLEALSDPIFRDHVVIAAGLSTSGLRSLMMSAKALLMPSISEGFGLPIVEALAQGIPVIASDIPAHREAGDGGEAYFFSLDDPQRWCERIEDLSAASGAPKPYRAKTWAQYFAGIETFLYAAGETTR